MAWRLPQKPWIVPIPGTTKPHRLKENLEAAKFELDASDLRKISEALAGIEIQGERYPAQMQAMVDR